MFKKLIIGAAIIGAAGYGIKKWLDSQDESLDDYSFLRQEPVNQVSTDTGETQEALDSEIESSTEAESSSKSKSVEA
ncbi:hypothetical protein LS68_002940 [Helicobacter sp. MIT 05-5293]|uniref:hypothetical protein n=1 Tax=Helicobacter sp. MIT 05-5293 TaxID=1548149 RepID=UPI00051CC9D6|nr:hypothetical protein [Helicobacter sp. MIT 05-5293]TLD81985.1 hypothetical protein LS68_002940 [Helicobacter sp. MIT 05-5293]